MAKIDIQDTKQRFGIIGNSPLLDRAIEVAIQVAPTDMSVLVVGESGVGKEAFPRIIHQNSRRKHNTYIAVNCGAIPEGTIDSELFGHIKGSFTGAIGDRKGYFEEANGGTIFLDEVGELPLSTQARLLRVLETGEFIPVGASKALRADVRIVAATNVKLREAVEKGKFREDLYFRLNTVPIEVPSLRDRASDIPLLFRYFAAMSADKYNMPSLRLDEEAKKIIEKYPFPGNIRELRNITERMSILESERYVNKDIIQKYLPDMSAMTSLIKVANNSDNSANFSSEREILYNVLFDMKKDMADLKLLVANILSGKIKIADYDIDSNNINTLTRSLQNISEEPEIETEVILDYPSISTKKPSKTIDISDQIEMQFEEKPLSLAELEKATIIASMKRNKGSRRMVAKELQIAERTLYRKLKEYDIDEKFK